MMGHTVVIVWPTELLATTFPIPSEDCSHREVPANATLLWAVSGHGLA